MGFVFVYFVIGLLIVSYDFFTSNHRVEIYKKHKYLLLVMVIIWPFTLWKSVTENSSSLKLKEGKSEYKKLCNQLLSKSIQDHQKGNEHVNDLIFLLFIRTICAFNFEGSNKSKSNLGGDFEEDIFRFELGCLLISYIKCSLLGKKYSTSGNLIEDLKKDFVQKTSYCLSRPIQKIEAIANDRASFYDRQFSASKVFPQEIIGASVEACTLSMKAGGEFIKFENFPDSVSLDLNNVFYSLAVQTWFTHVAPTCLDGVNKIIQSEG